MQEARLLPQPPILSPVPLPAHREAEAGGEPVPWAACATSHSAHILQATCTGRSW